jgi:Fe2+ transport system protein B
MSFMSQIGLDLEQLAQNVSRLMEQAATMPAPAEVQQVEGANEEHAQQTYRSSLRSVAIDIAQQTSRVRAYVEANAAAFERAAANMQQTDGADSLAARQADAFVQSIVADPVAPQAPSTPSSTSSSSRPGTGATAW